MGSVLRYMSEVRRFVSMDIRLIYREVPDTTSCAALERKLKSIAPVQESIDGGKRLWLSYMPETVYRPFAKPRAFDILVGATRWSDGEIEEFRMGMGAVPKRCLICRSFASGSRSSTEENTIIDVLFGIVFEIMTTTSALLCLDSATLRRISGTDPAWADDDDESWKAQIYRYPGQISEIAHERLDGDLWVEWIVDARWLRAWIDAKNRHRGVEKNDEFSRFASLDYTAT